MWVGVLQPDLIQRQRTLKIAQALVSAGQRVLCSQVLFAGFTQFLRTLLPVLRTQRPLERFERQPVISAGVVSPTQPGENLEQLGLEAVRLTQCSSFETELEAVRLTQCSSFLAVAQGLRQMGVVQPFAQLSQDPDPLEGVVYRVELPLEFKGVWHG